MLKTGTQLKPNRLVEGGDEILCRRDGIAIGLKACFVKKVRLRDSRVEVPEGEVEEGGEGDPEEVGEEEGGGGSGDGEEGGDGGGDGEPEEGNFCEGWADEVGAEEEGSPEGVECELEEEEGEGAFLGGRAAAFPDEPCGDAHEGVESGPDWAEEEAGRVP